MSDVVVRVGLEEPAQEMQLTMAIDAFAKSRQGDENPDVVNGDAPSIMVKTNWGTGGEVNKTLIFQDREWAAAFLRFWRDQRNSIG